MPLDNINFYSNFINALDGNNNNKKRIQRNSTIMNTGELAKDLGNTLQEDNLSGTIQLELQIFELDKINKYEEIEETKKSASNEEISKINNIYVNSSSFHKPQALSRVLHPGNVTQKKPKKDITSINSSNIKMNPGNKSFISESISLKLDKNINISPAQSPNQENRLGRSTSESFKKLVNRLSESHSDRERSSHRSILSSTKALDNIEYHVKSRSDTFEDETISILSNSTSNSSEDLVNLIKLIPNIQIILDDVENSPIAWKEFLNKSIQSFKNEPNKSIVQMPNNFENSFNLFEMLVLIKHIRPDALETIVKNFLPDIRHKLYSVLPKNVLESHARSNWYRKPTVLFFEKQDNNPSYFLELLAIRNKKTIQRIIMGEMPIKLLLDDIKRGAESGNWIILENLDLLKKRNVLQCVLNKVNEELESIYTAESFRVWITYSILTEDSYKKQNVRINNSGN